MGIVALHASSFDFRFLHRHSRLWGWRWRFKPCVLRHHSAKCNTDTSNDCQKDSASDSVIAHGFRSASNCKRSASHETANNGIPWIFLLSIHTSGRCPLSVLGKWGPVVPDALHSAIKGGEQPSPHSEVTTKDRSSSLHGCHCANTTFAIWRIALGWSEKGFVSRRIKIKIVPKAFDSMPHRSSDSLVIGG
jgi:hypothetical protein